LNGGDVADLAEIQQVLSLISADWSNEGDLLRLRQLADEMERADGTAKVSR
jgi:hypothetical protein